MLYKIIRIILLLVFLHRISSEFSFNKNMKARFRKVECTRPSGMCQNDVCYLKPITKNKVELSAFCAFLEPLKEMTMNAKIWQKKESEFDLLTNTTGKYCEIVKKKKVDDVMTALFYLFKSVDPKMIKPCPINEFFGFNNFTADETFIKYVKFPLSKATYRFLFELYVGKMEKFFTVSLTIDIVAVRNSNKQKQKNKG